MPLQPAPFSLSPDTLATFKLYLQSGKLIPGPLVTTLVQYLLQLSTDHLPQQGYILDGYPRDILQAEHLRTNFQSTDASTASDKNDFDVRPQLLVLLDCKDRNILKRRMIGRGRWDDYIEVVERRLIDYYDQYEDVVGMLLKGGEDKHGQMDEMRVVQVDCGDRRQVLIEGIEGVVEKEDKRICVIGPPGGGKGVVGDRLMEDGRTGICVGDVLRGIVKGQGVAVNQGLKDVLALEEQRQSQGVMGKKGTDVNRLEAVRSMPPSLQQSAA